MSYIKPAIEELLNRLSEQEAAVATAQAAATKTRIGVNLLRELAGEEPMFPDAETALASGNGPTLRSITFTPAPDQFFNRPQATCVKEVLSERRARGLGPATVGEIYSVLKQGGYNFATKIEKDAISGLGVSIAKNSSLFVRLPSGQVGLAEWYGGAASKRRGKMKDGNDPTTLPEQADDINANEGDAADESAPPFQPTMSPEDLGRFPKRDHDGSNLGLESS